MTNAQENTTYYNMTGELKTIGFAFKKVGMLYINGVAMSDVPESLFLFNIPPGHSYMFTGKLSAQHLGTKWIPVE